MESTGNKGRIFNIQKFSVHDGPGVRDTVFMKGCPLHCIWCSNPESQSSLPQIGWRAKKCIGCGVCAGVCPCGVWTMHNNEEMTFPAVKATA